MADGTLYVPVSGTGEAPQSYVAPGAVTLDLMAVTAVFDGSGASGDFLPAVQLLDSSENVMATVVGSQVTAGDSAEVTFAPFLRQPSGASCGGKIDSTATAGATCGVHSVGSPSGRVLTADGGGGSSWTAPAVYHSQTAYENVATFPNSQSIGGGATAALSLAHVSQSLLLDFTAPATPKFKTTGVYAITVSVIGEGGVTTRNHFQMQLTPHGATIGVATYAQDVHSNVLADDTIGTVSWTAPMLINDTFQVKVINNDTAARGFDVFYMAVTRILIAT